MRDNSKLNIAVVLLGVAVVLANVAIMIQAHLLITLAQAVNDLETCKADGLVDCHIERDGLDYNVYGRMSK